MLNIASWPVSEILCLCLIIDSRIPETKTKIKLLRQQATKDMAWYSFK